MNDSKNPINVDVSLSAKADLAPIIKATPKVFKYLSYLLFGKREANNERYIRLSKAQTDIDEKGILEGRLIFNAKENTLSSTNLDFKQQIVGAIQDEEIQNLIACSIKAAENIKEGETEKEPSQDFINRWRNDAKQIHSEELQNIWGRLMSEEINNPDSISLRTFDVIKNISKEEAESFIGLLKYIMDVPSYNKTYGIQVYSGWHFGKSNDFLAVNASDELKLHQINEAGLLIDCKFNKSSSFTISDKMVNNRLVYYLETINYIFYFHNYLVKILPQIYFLRLTQSAQEIYKLLCNDKNNRRPHKQDAIDFIQVVKNQLVYCDAKHVYFGYIEDDGRVNSYEKYPLL